MKFLRYLFVCGFKGHRWPKATIWLRMLTSPEYRACERCGVDWWTENGR